MNALHSCHNLCAYLIHTVKVSNKSTNKYKRNRNLLAKGITPGTQDTRKKELRSGSIMEGSKASEKRQARISREREKQAERKRKQAEQATFAKNKKDDQLLFSSRNHQAADSDSESEASSGGDEDELLSEGEDNTAADYESRPRRVKAEEKQRMPIKNADGSWGKSLIPAAVASSQLNDADIDVGGYSDSDGGDSSSDDGTDLMAAINHEDGDDSEEEEDEGVDEAEKARKRAALDEELKRKAETRVKRVKTEIALAAEAVLENPEKWISKIHHIYNLSYHEDIEIQYVAMLSQAEIYKDILPGM